MDQTLAVRMRGVCKRYPHFTLDGMDLSVRQGSIMGFLGANGAGKSTTLRILMGLVLADAGDVCVLGHEIPAGGALARQEIGFVSEDLRLYGRATLQWHMGFVASFYPRWDQAYAERLLRRFDLRPAQQIKGMSHGQRVKAALLLVLARHPRLLVLDEPTSALDPVARHEVLATLMEVMGDEERSVLFSSHNTHEVEQIADAVTIIDRGRLLETDDKESCLDRWRRLRLEVPAGVTLPRLPSVVALQGHGRAQVLTSSDFGAELTAALQAAGARIHAVETMSLEEIFVSTVMHRREETTA
ncbi:ABC transporter ATP-binding protein [Massilia arenosa]|uniref:ABC transporter ATP-binding protein n=1 Tax=Zemynaea arenosa TaxID=2561931 RepID=A0A4Y9RNN2_9BURK|nr:ABC transporter ATP-binding protein [Massilia arenosa]TFW10634.1 ABC transporter ATP-binding protein [Massilia arenosa]